MSQNLTKKIIFTVTNDLTYDQRMTRICTSLSQAGYEITLIGFEKKNSLPLAEKPYKQIRVKGLPENGKILYAKYWKKLYFLLLKLEADAICAIDLDTILPVYLASKKKKVLKVYDAHEIFTELKEVVTRPPIYLIWSQIAKRLLPKFKNGYTIGKYYAQYFKKHYGVDYEIVRNATILKEDALPAYNIDNPYILYQGAVNEGRCFEQLIPAMQYVNCKLIICGHGNFFEKAIVLTKQYQLEDKIEFKGYLQPKDLIVYTRNATIGITLFEADNVLSNYYSMANRFFDYMHNGIPQLCNAYPEYIDVNKTYRIAHLIDNTSVQTIADALNSMLSHKEDLQTMRNAALKAREIYCWQEDEKRLIKFYEQLFQ
jgi:glycosyltransferase involved in cell wall biosynthesis